jgi:hypothetical protein
MRFGISEELMEKFPILEDYSGEEDLDDIKAYLIRDQHENFFPYLIAPEETNEAEGTVFNYQPAKEFYLDDDQIKILFKGFFKQDSPEIDFRKMFL